MPSRGLSTAAVAACAPVLPAAETLVGGLVLGLGMLLTLGFAQLPGAATRSLPEGLRLGAAAVVAAAGAGAYALALRAFAFEIDIALGSTYPALLLAAGAVAAVEAGDRAPGAILRAGAIAATAAMLVGAARELLARGALLTDLPALLDPGQVAPEDAGTALVAVAQAPAAAFFALGLGIAGWRAFALRGSAR